MLKVDNLYYFIDVETVLNKLNIKIHSQSNGNYMLCCPFHKEHNPSFGIHSETGVYKCFGCGEKGNILDFVTKVLDTDKFIALQFLSSLHIDHRAIPKIKQDKPLFRTEYNYNRTIDFKLYKYFHNRNLTKKTIDLFDVGLEGDYITFPIKNSVGTVAAVQKRHIETKKFLFPKGFNIKDYIFGLYELLIYGDKTKPVIICESVIDCMTIWEFGGQAIALYSAMISKNQMKLLASTPFNKFKDGFDRDGAGRIGWEIFKEQAILRGLRVIESREHGKKDINELSVKEIMIWLKN